MRDGVRHGVFVLRSPLFGNGIPDLATEIVMMVFAVAVVMVAFMAVVAVWASVVIIAHRCVQFSLGAFEEVWVCIVGERGTGGYVMWLCAQEHRWTVRLVRPQGACVSGYGEVTVGFVEETWP